MDRARLANGVYALFGAVMTANGVLSLRSSPGVVSVLFVCCGLGILIGSLVAVVRPDATVLGLELGVDDLPTWTLALLLLASATMLVGTILQL